MTNVLGAYEVATSPLDRLRNLRPAQRSTIFEPDTLKLLGNLWLDEEVEVQRLLDAWRESKLGNIKELRDAIVKASKVVMGERSAAEDSHPVNVECGGPDLHRFVTEVQEAMDTAMPNRVFRRSGDLVRLKVIESVDESDDDALPEGTTVITPVDVPWLQLATSRAGISFVRFNSETQMWVAVRPPASDLRLLLAEPEGTSFPVIKGVSLVPTLSRSTPGYDPVSGMFLSFPENAFPRGPREPSKEDALAALARLKAPMREYRFKDEASLSVVLSGFIAGVVRPQMKTCPIHAINAPMAGSGKSKISICTGIIATGVRPPQSSFSANDEENEKRLVTNLLNGVRIISFDNVASGVVVQGAFLDSMMTENPKESRLLGEHRQIILDTTVLVLVNGNGLRIGGDTVRRSIIATIDVGVTNPVEVVHSFDPVEEVTRNRAQLVTDCLTVVRAWIRAGRPLPDGYRRMASFEEYDLVRGPLLWLGEPDPALTQKSLFELDDERQMRAEVLHALRDCFGTERFRTREIVREPDFDTDAARKARDELFNIISEHTEFRTGTIGKLLHRLMDKPTGDVVLRCEFDPHHQVKIWWVEEIEGVQG